MNRKEVSIPGISCGHCVSTIERELMELDGLKSVKGDPVSKRVVIEWDAPTDWRLIAGTLEEIGYPPGE